MTSVSGKMYKQTNLYFVPVGDCRTSIHQYAPGPNGKIGSFSQAYWTINGSNGYSTEYMSSIATAGAGGVFRDMGKTVVSSGLTFRKIELIVNSSATNAGPAGAAVARILSPSPKMISQFVPTSMNKRSRLSRSIPDASAPATISPPTYAPSEGIITAFARG